MLKLDRMRPPVRRVLALDAGSRCIKLLLAESDFGRLHILKEELIDLQAEGLVSADEIKAHLQASLEGWGRPNSIGGHEYTGTVAAVGDAVTGWKVGDTAVGGPTVRCGTCEYCRAGRPSLCSGRSSVGEGGD